MGRNPNGAVRDISGRYGSLSLVPVALLGLAVSARARRVARRRRRHRPAGALPFAGAIALVVWPQAAELVVARRRAPTRAERRPAARVGRASTRPLTADEVREIDRASASTEVPA